MRLTPEELAARKRRNIALAWALVGFMALVFTTTFLRMQHNRAEAVARQAVLAAQATAQTPAARP